MTSTDLALRALDGLHFGIVLVLLASGFALVASSLRFVNLAHGALYGAAAYAAMVMAGITRNHLVAAALTIAASVLIGVALDRYVFRRFHAADWVTRLLITLAAAFVLADAAMILAFVPVEPPALPPLLAQNLEIATGIVVPLYRLLQIAIGIVAALVLVYVVRGTPFGLQLRAVASDPGAAATLGIEAAPFQTAAFVIAAGLAGLAAAVAVPPQGFPAYGSDVALLYTVLAVAVAGVRSLPLLAGVCLVIGFADTLGRHMLSETVSRLLGIAPETGQGLLVLLLFGAAAIVLAVRPRGIAASVQE
jgi:branched-chain amino acid transport system permease protein